MHGAVEGTYMYKNHLYMEALAGVAQWIERQTVKQRVAGSIPSQGTFLGCGPGLQSGACERQPHINVSLTLFLHPYSSLKKQIHKIFKKIKLVLNQ